MGRMKQTSSHKAVVCVLKTQQFSNESNLCDKLEAAFTSGISVSFYAAGDQLLSLYSSFGLN